MSPSPESVQLVPLPPFQPDLYHRAWQSIPHPTLPLLATAHKKSVTVFSLTTLSAHSVLTNGHERSVRSATWKPNLTPHKLCIVTGSFDSTAGLWRWSDEPTDNLEVEVTSPTSPTSPPSPPSPISPTSPPSTSTNSSDNNEYESDKDWELIIILDGQDSEIKSVSFSPTGQYLATCSRDKSVWIWEDIGANEDDDEWETVAVLNEHDGDVKAVAWCPEKNRTEEGRNARYCSEVLASASYDNTVRVWREEIDQEWICVAVLSGHQGTVWGVQWEPNPKGDGFPRIMTWSADMTIRVWTLKEEPWRPRPSGGGLIPNTMRPSLKEKWTCTAVLPQVHTRDIYSVTWSPVTGMVASTGSDGLIVVYTEIDETTEEDEAAAEDEVAEELDGDVPMTNGHSETSQESQESEESEESEIIENDGWKVVSMTSAAHGPYEVNHITWCKRYDQGCAPEKRGVEEMLVTTGDDGIVRPWQVIQS